MDSVRIAHLVPRRSVELSQLVLAHTDKRWTLTKQNVLKAIVQRHNTLLKKDVKSVQQERRLWVVKARNVAATLDMSSILTPGYVNYAQNDTHH